MFCSRWVPSSWPAILAVTLTRLTSAKAITSPDIAMSNVWVAGSISVPRHLRMRASTGSPRGSVLSWGTNLNVHGLDRAQTPGVCRRHGDRGSSRIPRRYLQRRLHPLTGRACPAGGDADPGKGRTTGCRPVLQLLTVLIVEVFPRVSPCLWRRVRTASWAGSDRVPWALS